MVSMILFDRTVWEILVLSGSVILGIVYGISQHKGKLYQYSPIIYGTTVGIISTCLGYAEVEFFVLLLGFVIAGIIADVFWEKGKIYRFVQAIYAVAVSGIAICLKYIVIEEILILFTVFGLLSSTVISGISWNNGWAARYAPIIYCAFTGVAAVALGWAAKPSDTLLDRLEIVMGWVFIGVGFWFAVLLERWDDKRKRKNSVYNKRNKCE
ncbi:MAG: hypothetical protein LBF50_10185 [Azoarcus sp.]|jgi:hypothetical protein|nr:hypothetical protein [Azoarcus sp.]